MLALVSLRACGAIIALALIETLIMPKRLLRKSTTPARLGHRVRCVNPVRNPYAPGAGSAHPNSVAVILDGLNEIPVELRPVPLRALSQQAPGGCPDPNR